MDGDVLKNYLLYNYIILGFWQAIKCKIIFFSDRCVIQVIRLEMVLKQCTNWHKTCKLTKVEHEIMEYLVFLEELMAEFSHKLGVGNIHGSNWGIAVWMGKEITQPHGMEVSHEILRIWLLEKRIKLGADVSWNWELSSQIAEGQQKLCYRRRTWFWMLYLHSNWEVVWK